MKPVLTAADLEQVPSGGEIQVAANTLITPLARDEAERRGITIRMSGVTVDSPASAVPSTSDGMPLAASQNRDRGIDGLPVAIGSDHGGYDLKEYLKGYLRDWGHGILDVGTDSTAAVDYPDYAELVANAVARGDAALGVVIDSAGIGSSIAANKVTGVRAALCYDRATARNSREHNDANVLSLGAKLMLPEAAREILAVWLATPFAGGRHQKRVDKIIEVEERQRKK